ncbi:MAG TPA: hypothetical protein VHK69_16725 [Chitinophagaceae bacterium]|nr:hypothetical protein [Chitinophagaceae bacterium]
MRTAFLLLLVLAGVAGTAQQPPSMNVSMTDKLNRDRDQQYMNQEIYYLEGKNVIGNPFLHGAWVNGSLSTADGNTYTHYRLKYNLYNQAVTFLNGLDSMDVDAEITEFTLIVPEGKELKRLRFINASQLKKEKKTFYYQVLYSDAHGQLLKHSKKVVAEPDSNVPTYESHKIFRTDVVYYYYSEKTKKLTRLKTPASVQEAAGLSNEQFGELQSNTTYDFIVEEDLIRFFTARAAVKN